VAIWYIFPRFGMLCQEKSGNPGFHTGFCPKVVFPVFVSHNKFCTGDQCYDHLVHTYVMSVFFLSFQQKMAVFSKTNVMVIFAVH
jgi:hypothetical protein